MKRPCYVEHCLLSIPEILHLHDRKYDLCDHSNPFMRSLRHLKSIPRSNAYSSDAVLRNCAGEQ